MELKKPETKAKEQQGQPSAKEKLLYSRYYEHDGALRAYANRAMILGFLCVPTALLAVALAAYVRLQPPTVIYVSADGAASVVGQKGMGPKAVITIAKGASADAGDFERKAFVRLFLDRYLNFSPDSVNQNWADSVNMMTTNLRRATLSAMEKDNTVGEIQDNQITSLFQWRSLDPSKEDPLTFTAFGVRDIHHVQDHAERSVKLVGEYHIRLTTEKRSEQNPSGLLIAEYEETTIEGEKRDASVRDSVLGQSK